MALEEGVKILAAECFRNSKIAEIIIPKSVEIIEREAFDGCRYLEKVTFTEGSLLREIDNYAFNGCYRL